MRLLKPFLVVLLAWTLSFQAMAGAMGSSCRHQPRAMPAQTSGTTGAAGHHAGMHHETPVSQAAGAHAHHAMGSTAPGTVAKTVLALGCACGCDCAMLGCGSASSSMAATSGLSTFDLPPGNLCAAPALAALSKAHVLDLIRPPSRS